MLRSKKRKKEEKKEREEKCCGGKIESEETMIRITGCITFPASDSRSFEAPRSYRDTKDSSSCYTTTFTKPAVVSRIEFETKGIALTSASYMHIVGKHISRGAFVRKCLAKHAGIPRRFTITPQPLPPPPILYSAEYPPQFSSNQRGSRAAFRCGLVFPARAFRDPGCALAGENETEPKEEETSRGGTNEMLTSVF